MKTDKVKLNYHEIKEECATRRLLISIFKDKLPKPIYTTLVSCNAQLEALNEMLGRKNERVQYTYSVERLGKEAPDA